MYLKTVILRGFKSFANKTVVSFEPGINIIVGPNGSGKSNLIDAILWVFGEQNARALRASLMGDVVFAGTKARPPLGMAEATVVLDNSCGTLPLEFSEVSITRRLYRSGESQYFLNGSPCRLIDIQEILADSGIGQKLHTIISQGQIEEVINSSPEERRRLVEEVAGVFKYRRRKERALKRLESFQESVERLDEIVSELEKKLRPLRLQAKKSLKAQSITDELQELTKNFLAQEIKQARMIWEECSSKEEKKLKEALIIKEKIEKNNHLIKQCQAELGEYGLTSSDLNRIKDTLHQFYEKINGNLMVLEEKGKNLIEKLSESRRRIYQLEKKLREKKEEREHYLEEKYNLDRELESLHRELNHLQKVSEGIKKERLEKEKRHDHLLSQIERVEKELQNLSLASKTYSLELQSISSSLNLLASEEEKLNQETERLKKEEARLSEELEVLKGKKKETTGSLDSIKAELEKAEEEKEQNRKEQDELQERIAELLAETHLINELICRESKPNFSYHKKIKKLFEVIEVEEGYEKAVQIALQDKLSAFLINKEKIDEFLKKTQEESFAFLVLPIKSGKSIKKISGLTPLMEKIKFNSYKEEIEPLLNDFYLVENSVQAVKLGLEYPDFGFVTPEGFLFKNSLGQKNEFLDLLSKKRDLERIEKKKEALLEKVENLRKEACRLEEWKKKLENRVKQVGEELTQIDLEIVYKEKELEKTREGKKRIEARIAGLFQQRKELNKKKKTIEEKAKSCLESLRQKEVEKNKLTSGLREFSQPLRKDILEKERRAAEEIAQCQLKISTLIEKAGFLKKQFLSVEKEIKEQGDLFLAEEKVVEEYEKVRDKIQPFYAILKKILTGIEIKLDFVNNLAQTERDSFTSLREKISSLIQANEELQKKLVGLQEEIGEIGSEKARMKERVANLVEQAKEDLNLPVETLVREYPKKNFTREQIQKEIADLRSRLQRLGPVNPLAVEETKKLEKRKAFFEEQLLDVREAEKVLGRILLSLEKKLRDRFLETFEKINQNFQQTFSYLFSDGRAELILSKGEPLDAGIEIVAEPQGRKLKKLSLLSGGERAMVALSLLFAFHYTSPSPIYIFDEVEPALDSLNLARFIKLLEKIKEEAQIIVITHQRQTMEAGETIHGVTLGADGISRVYSQKFAEVSRFEHF